jgi:hypothetical protein
MRNGGTGGINGDTRYAVQPLHQTMGEPLFMGLNAIHPDLLQVFHRCREADPSGNMGGACFKAFIAGGQSVSVGGNCLDRPPSQKQRIEPGFPHHDRGGQSPEWV